MTGRRRDARGSDEEVFAAKQRRLHEVGRAAAARRLNSFAGTKLAAVLIAHARLPGVGAVAASPDPASVIGAALHAVTHGLTVCAAAAMAIERAQGKACIRQPARGSCAPRQFLPTLVSEWNSERSQLCRFAWRLLNREPGGRNQLRLGPQDRRVIIRTICAPADLTARQCRIGVGHPSLGPSSGHGLIVRGRRPAGEPRDAAPGRYRYGRPTSMR